MKRLDVATAGDNPPALPAELVDVVAVAALLSVSPRTVLRLAARGILPPALKLGRCRRWSRRSIMRFIDAVGGEVAR